MMDVGRLGRVIAEQAHQLASGHRPNIEAAGLVVADSPNNFDQARVVEVDRVVEEGSFADTAGIELGYTVVLV